MRAARVGRDTAGEVLDRVWAAARPWAATVLGPSDLESVDDLVSGRLPLPLEDRVSDDVEDASGEADRVAGYGPRLRGELEVSVVAASWWKAMLEVRSPERTRWVTLPGRALDAVLGAQDTGTLDPDLAAIVSR